MSGLIVEIGAATEARTGGIGQASDAISEFDHVTQLDHVMQQNSALVEDVAAAAKTLRQQAGRLVDAVVIFRR